MFWKRGHSRLGLVGRHTAGERASQVNVLDTV